jgi:ABC-2 type transport system permease protein
VRRSDVGLIAAREIGVRLRAKSFRILTGLLVVLILAIGVLGRLASGGGDDVTVVGVAGPVPAGFAAAAEATAERFGGEIEVTDVEVTGADDVVGAARRALEGGDAEVVVLGEERRVVYDGDVDDEVQAVVQQAWSSAEIRQALVDSGLSPDEADQVAAPTPLAATPLDGEDEDEGLAVLTGTLAAVLLFLSLQTFGNYVLVGVVEEKSSAVVELLLVRVRADQLLAGKVIGIGAVALLQFVLAVTAGLAALAVSGTDVPGEIWSAVPLTTVWFLGGYALYSTLFALAGALVSRQEEAQAAAAPILTAMIGSYVVIYLFGYTPESAASRFLSVLPPVSPFLMPMRMTAGAASVVEVAVALVLLFGATVAAWKLASRIYEEVLLRRGSRIAWREVLALARQG